jgi:hypothetical protein
MMNDPLWNMSTAVIVSNCRKIKIFKFLRAQFLSSLFLNNHFNNFSQLNLRLVSALSEKKKNIAFDWKCSCRIRSNHQLQCPTFDSILFST